VNEREIKYAIPYEHLEDELVMDAKTKFHFNEVKNKANEWRLELTDNEFRSFFKLTQADKDISWMMHKMSRHNLSFVDALILCITS